MAMTPRADRTPEDRRKNHEVAEAAEKNDVTELDRLIKLYGVKIEDPNGSLCLACSLSSAVLANAIDAVRYLLDLGVDFDGRKVGDAIKIGSIPILELFREHGWRPDDDLKNPFARTALNMASSQRNPELIRYLLGLGADPGLGPLAAHFGSMRLCMIEKNAPYNLYYAASTGCLETLKLLLKYSKVDLKCACLLHGAVTGRSSEVLDHVLGLGIDVEEPDNLELTGRWGYKTPLHRAMAFGNVDAITILMTRGASVKRMGYQSVYDICGDDLLTPDLEGYEGNEIPKEIKDLVHKLSLNTEMA